MQSPIGVSAILELKRQYLIPCIYHFYREPPQFVRGKGVYLYDDGGKPYLDLFAGVSVNALGHCHPELVAAITEQVRTLQHTTTIYLTEPIVRLAEALAAELPGDLDRTFFCASGSEANEGAALLAMLYTGRQGFLAFTDALHGRTRLGMNLTHLPMWRTDPHPPRDVVHVPRPDCRNCPAGRKAGCCSFECVAAVEEAILSHPCGKPAAMFAEIVQGNGGINPAPPGYYPRLREVLDRHGCLLVADEVQTGFGRTGRMFASEHEGVTPDILTGGKALGGGTPIGFFSTTGRVAACYTRPGASTFGGNPVTATAGLAFLRILKREGLVQRSASLGRHLLSRLGNLTSRFDFIRDVRGRGLMIGIEFGARGEEPAPQLLDNALEKLKDRGYLFGKTGAGRNVLTWMPPLIISQQQLEEAADAVETVLHTL